MQKKIPILDELEKVQQILNYGFTSHRITSYEVGLIAKYHYMNGMKYNDIKNSIIDFCKKHDQYFNEIIYEKLINKCIRMAKIYKLKNGVMNIPINENEIAKIKHLPHKLYRILFVMIILARLQKFSNTKLYDTKKKRHGYYLNMDFSSILAFARIRATKKQIDIIKYQLDGNGGYISSNLFSENSWRILFADDKSEPLVVVDDINNILDFIPYYCIDCGNKYEKKGIKERCNNCYVIYRKTLNREQMRKSRKN